MKRGRINPKRYEPFDVVVVGGGMAGVAAAIAAGRAGAKIALVESAGWLGGIGITGATALHNFYNIFGAEKEAEPLRVAAGIAQELVDRVKARDGGIGHVPVEGGADYISVVTPLEPEVFKAVANQMCEEAGVHLLLHTVMDDVWASAGHIDGLVVWNKAGRSLLRAKQYIDCTGDGDLAAYAGTPFEHYKPGQTGVYWTGFTFRLGNVDLAAMEADLDKRGLIIQIAHAVKPRTSRPDIVRLGINTLKLRQEGIEEAPVYFFSTSLRPRELTFCNCINHGPTDALDPAALTAAEIYARERLLSMERFFREHIGGCREAYAAGPAPSVGPRRARGIHCDYEITLEDCVEARRFDDAIGCFGFIDHPTNRIKNAGAYNIPYRALIPKELDNALIAGRMMTTDFLAHNSTRNTVSCLICGQAAGTAAAMAAERGRSPREVDVEALRSRLRAAGVLLEPQPEPSLLKRYGTVVSSV